MGTALAVIGLVLALVLLWTGVKKLRFQRPVEAVLSVADLLALGFALWQLEWLGLVLFVAVNVLGLVAWGAAGAVQVESAMSEAAAQSGADVAELTDVHRQLVARRDLRSLGPRRLAKLMVALAKRARGPAEIREMAPPLAYLWIGQNKPDLDWLVGSFDGLARLYGKEADDAEEMADILTAATQRSAATFEDMVEAMIVAAGGSIEPRASKAA